mgnify:CR=1 FL=1
MSREPISISLDTQELDENVLALLHNMDDPAPALE